MSTRRLRLLLINDEDESKIGNDNIDVVEFRNEIGGKTSALMTWEQHLRMWFSRDIPTFDLLLIDINFSFDVTDPKYFGEGDSKLAKRIIGSDGTEKVVYPNPLGLLHALPLAGRQGLTNMPFIWGVHSGDASQVKGDPVAVVTFGLLCAMENRAGWEEYDDPEPIIDYFSKQLGALPSQNPTTALRALIEPYRKRLLQACAGKVYVELDSLQKLLVQATRRDEKDLKELAKEPLFIYSGYDENAILLRSLFADFETWDEVVVAGDVLQYLTQLKEVTEKWTDIFPAVCKSIEALDSDPGANRTIKQVIPKVVNHAWIGVGVIVCLWLRRHFHHQPGNLENILVDLGTQGNYHAPERLLEGAGFFVTPQKFLDRLMTEELLPVWRECGRRYFLDVLGWNRSGRASREWPACLGPEP